MLKDTWQKINGKWYFFGNNGIMARNCWIQGYWLGANGAWSYPYRGSWHRSARGWWYGDTSGWYAKSGTYRIDGRDYTFDRKGYSDEK